jgi:hypothetical protein
LTSIIDSDIYLQFDLIINLSERLFKNEYTVSDKLFKLLFQK